jgi:predicted ATPase/DNA-binding winged helix-turn-helix (wHTH) protein
MALERAKGTDPAFGEFADFGPFRLFPGARVLARDGAPVEIGARAFDVLLALVAHAGKVVSKAELISSIWADTTVVEGVLRVHVHAVRRALGEGVGGSRYITSVAGRGYCFVAPVVRGKVEGARAVAIAETSSAAPTWKLAGGLPPPLARMAGRDEAVRTLVADLEHHRFVTILGAAGIGKTTLAVCVGHALMDSFGRAVRFIELGSVTDPTLVATTVASTLGMQVQSDDALPSVQAFLRDKRVLLVLDNCEHLVDAAARLAEDLFFHAPRVHLLTTSREALRVEGERVYRLLPLETPTAHAGLNAESVQTFPAVQVFLERAAASGWSGHLTDDDAPIVAEICRRLDGVALALELAASFMGERGLKGTAAMLDDRLGLLFQHGRRTAPPRQQTLHALIAWSYDRLSERERAVLRSLSVFVGAFTVEAARAVALRVGETEESLREDVNALLGKSLLSFTVEDSSIVYRLVETTRVYALERLAESGELEDVSLRHALLFAERLGCAPREGRETKKEMEAARVVNEGARQFDLPNVRAALDWAFSSRAGHAIGARLAAAAAGMLLDRGLVSECHDRCHQAIEVIGEPDKGTLVELALCESLAVSAMYSTRGIDQEVRFALIRGLELARALGDGDREIRLLGYLNGFLIRTGDWSGALEVAERSADAARRTRTEGTLRAEWMLALSHHCLGNHALAQEYCEAGLRLAATSSEVPMRFFQNPHVILTLARTLWLRGEADRAVTVARPVIDQARTLDHPVTKCVVLLLAEPIFVWRGEWDEAGRLVDMLAEHVERYSLASHRGVAMHLRGELLVKTGRPQEGCTVLRAAQSLLKTARNASHDTYLTSALAEGLAATGAVDEALAAIGRGIALAEDRGGTWDLPELLRLKGTLLASRSPADEQAGEQALSSAVAVARRQGALAWELRAATTLARARWGRPGSLDALRDLSAIYAKFTEGLQTPDLQAAHSLLEGHVGPMPPDRAL